MNTKLVPIEIKRFEEQWSVCELVDGSVIKTKWVYVHVFAVYGDDNQQLKNQDGTLMYQIHMHAIHSTVTPMANMQTSTMRN